MATVATLKDTSTVVGIKEKIPSPIAQRFPVPTQAVGALRISDVPYGKNGGAIASGGALFGALVVEGSYMEPTLGQIWPRIG